MIHVNYAQVIYSVLIKGGVPISGVILLEMLLGIYMYFLLVGKHFKF